MGNTRRALEEPPVLPLEYRVIHEVDETDVVKYRQIHLPLDRL
jgi:hypothetical protein